jgi:hypothetical protein
MEGGSLTMVYADRANPLGRHLDRMADLYSAAKVPWSLASPTRRPQP